MILSVKIIGTPEEEDLVFFEKRKWLYYNYL